MCSSIQQLLKRNSHQIFDMFYVHDRGTMLSVYLFGQQLGSILGLISGGTIADTVGWRWSQYICAIIDGVVFVSLLMSFEETFFPRFLFASNPTLTTPSLNQENGLVLSSESARKNNLRTTNSLTSRGEGFMDAFPRRRYFQILKPWIRIPENKATFWQYFRRPFFLWGFPNIVIVSLYL